MGARKTIEAQKTIGARKLLISNTELLDLT